jgi:Fic-DOC domain mobile mystery protein B
MRFTFPDGATPIDANDELDLKMTHITTQAQLNEAELENIIRSRTWSRGRKRSNLLTTDFMERLHTRMFSDVWKWAGKRRTKELQNEKFSHYYSIPIEIERMLADIAYRLEHSTPTTGGQWDRLGAEFHHRLVKIHYFTNGNGRHARELTDLLLIGHGQKPFTWGGRSLVDMSESRTRYIEALRAADNGEYSPLVEFVRS